MARQKEVKITNGEQVGYCLESSLEAWEDHGWTRADDGSSDDIETNESQVEPEPEAVEAEED